MYCNPVVGGCKQKIVAQLTGWVEKNQFNIDNSPEGHIIEAKILM
jgi:hypothetical protein